MRMLRMTSTAVLGMLMLCIVVLWISNAGAHTEKSGGEGPVGISVKTTASKLLAGRDRQVVVALTLSGRNVRDASRRPSAQTSMDLVVVLDRSGSMAGKKIEDARRAVVDLIDSLSERDRFGLVVYSDQAETRVPVRPMTPSAKASARSAALEVTAAGSTNLSGGLELGVEALKRGEGEQGRGRIILVTDGLANRGEVDPRALSKRARRAADDVATVSTIGVGLDFNESLLTSMADYGQGNYRFLENPSGFGEAFAAELRGGRESIARNLAVKIAPAPGVEVLAAGGFPLEHSDGGVRFRPGDLLAGGSRTVFITLKTTALAPGTAPLCGLSATYDHDGKGYEIAALPTAILVTPDEAEAVASLDKPLWEKKVLQEDYGRLKEAVAAAVGRGDKGAAEREINDYVSAQRSANAAVGSGKVEENLAKDVGKLQSTVNEVFAAPPAAAPEVQNRAAKSVGQEAYSLRRDKQ